MNFKGENTTRTLPLSPPSLKSELRSARRKKEEASRRKMEAQIDKETRRKIKKSVKNILQGEDANLYVLNEKLVRQKASADLNLDLNQPLYKKLVRKHVENFLIQEKSKPKIAEKIIK
ncbi:mediator-associated protein 3 [Mangifera indica]|uniref:mediator-associated protein 3 n=1 Tax=Mangifera indica TaxID=29780 RepID=UPI001CFBABA0|nr:mediator-associated protein 3 [Mangifera indica]